MRYRCKLTHALQVQANSMRQGDLGDFLLLPAMVDLRVTVFKNSSISQGKCNKRFGQQAGWRLPDRGIGNRSFFRADNYGMLLINPQEPGSTTMELILEKIAVPTQLPHLTRPRLFKILEQSLGSGTSTILSGRAGTGKTALALDFARKCGRPVSWYKVDAPDAEIKIFFQYLIASIRKQRPAFGDPMLLPLLSNAGPQEVYLLAEAFVYELSEGDTQPLLIVIDDLHQVCDSPWLVQFFRRLLPLLPAEVHMLITSRSMPPAPLWRMRSKQTLLVIDEETLAFTSTEALELFESHGLSGEHARIALDHTHGRAAALAGFAASLGKVENLGNRYESLTRELVSN